MAVGGVRQIANRGQLQQMAEELGKVIALDEGESKRLEVRLSHTHSEGGGGDRIENLELGKREKMEMCRNVRELRC